MNQDHKRPGRAIQDLTEWAVLVRARYKDVRTRPSKSLSAHLISVCGCRCLLRTGFVERPCIYGYSAVIRRTDHSTSGEDECAPRLGCLRDVGTGNTDPRSGAIRKAGSSHPRGVTTAKIRRDLPDDTRSTRWPVNAILPDSPARPETGDLSARSGSSPNEQITARKVSGPSTRSHKKLAVAAHWPGAKTRSIK